MNVLIVAGGRGSRLQGYRGEVPKPMVPLAGKPVLEYQIELAKRAGCTAITMLTGYEAETIEHYFQDGRRWGVQISYHRETHACGTAGAVKALEGRLGGPFLVFYGDLMMDLDLEALIAAHRPEATATLVVHPSDHPFDSDLIEVDAQGRIVGFHHPPHHTGAYRNLVNAGIYVLSPRILTHIPPDRASDFGLEVFPATLKAGERLEAYRTTEYVKDVGTPTRYDEVLADVLAGKPARWRRGQKRRTVFLDRDGVINKEVDLLHRLEDLEVLPGVAAAIRRLNQAGFLSVVVTNQPVVARGLCTEAELAMIHRKLETLLGHEGAYLDGIYYCPHHPGHDAADAEAESRRDCPCRKPKPGMIQQAVGELPIDLEASYLIGDRSVDIQTGINAGLTTILLRTGYAGADGTFACKPDLIFSHLAEAVGFLVANLER
jgi:D,D-heptose 1,7-bisphosphate phosphatase